MLKCVATSYVDNETIFIVSTFRDDKNKLTRCDELQLKYSWSTALTPVYVNREFEKKTL